MRMYLVKVNGITCPMCMESLDGPRPVYKKKGLFFSYRSRIPPRSLNISKIFERALPLTEEETSTKIVMWLMSCQPFKSFQYSFIDSSGSELINEFVVVNSVLVHSDNF